MHPNVFLHIVTNAFSMGIEPLPASTRKSVVIAERKITEPRIDARETISPLPSRLFPVPSELVPPKSTPTSNSKFPMVQLPIPKSRKLSRHLQHNPPILNIPPHLPLQRSPKPLTIQTHPALPLKLFRHKIPLLK
jgi:hypothetical protein